MPLIDRLSVQLSCEEILRRLPVSSRAFAARPAPELVDTILRTIAAEKLVDAKAAYELHELDGSGDRGITPGDGELLQWGDSLPEMAGPNRMIAVCWTLGTGISRAVSTAFAGRRYLEGLLLHEIGSLHQFALGELVFAHIAAVLAPRGRGLGSVAAPGDEQLALAAQQRVLALAGAARIGVGMGRAGTLTPAFSATAVAELTDSPGEHARAVPCPRCRVWERCRLRRA